MTKQVRYADGSCAREIEEQPQSTPQLELTKAQRATAHTERTVQKVVDFFGVRLGPCARMRLEQLLREIQDDARI